MKLPIILTSFTLILISTTAMGAMQPLQYDGNGNLTSGLGLFYEYNDANKLVRVREGASDGPVKAEYWYDYKGQRLKKIENGITTYYIGKHYEERRGQSVNEQTNFYFAGGQRVARKTRSNNKPAETIFYLNNHLGSADLVTDESGSVVEKMAYFPYGKVSNAGSARYGYTGKEKDLTTGLNYYEARYYNADSRHFTQADTVTPNVYAPQSFNRYSYVKNNPIKLIDPSGHRSEWTNNLWNTAKRWGSKLNIKTAYSSVGSPELAAAPSTHGYQWKSQANKNLFHHHANESSRIQQQASATIRNQKESVVPALEAMQGIGEISKGAVQMKKGDLKGGAWSMAKGAYRIKISILKARGDIDTFASSDIFYAASEMQYAAGNTEKGDMAKNFADIATLVDSAHGTLTAPLSFDNLDYGAEYVEATMQMGKSIYNLGADSIHNAKKLK